MDVFQPGDTVAFTCSSDRIVGQVEEIRDGHEGNFLLVVRQGLPLLGSRYVVLSSYAKKLAARQAPQLA